MKKKMKNLLKNDYFKVIILSFIIGSIIIIPNIINGHGIFSIFSDFNYQQIPFGMNANESIKNGEVFFEWHNDIGSSFIGTYSFYMLGSPFFLLSLLFKSTWYPYIIGPLLILKFVLAALFAFIYIKRYVKNKNYAIVGSLLYAFSGFQISNLLFHFTDTYTLFPLLLIALDKTMYEDKKGWFLLAVFINALNNYFSFAGQVVFLVIYFIIKLLTKEYKLTLKKFITLAIESILGVALSAVILIPSILFVLENPRMSSSWNIVSALKPQTSNILEILRGFILVPDIMSSRTFYYEYLFTSSELYLPFVGSVLCLSYIWKNKKTWISILLITCAVFAFFPILNSFFFLLNTAYYARWFYMPILIMTLASSKALDEKLKLKAGYIGVGIVTLIFIAGNIYYKLKGNQVFIHPNYLYANILVSLFGYIGLLFIDKYRTYKKLYSKLLVSGIILSTLLISFLFFYKYDRLSPQEEYTNTFINSNLKLDYLKDGERTDSNTSLYPNIGYVLNIPHLSNFNTSLAGGAFTFYQTTGLERFVRTTIGEDYPKVRDYLSTKYILVSANESMDNNLVEVTNNYKVYENKNYIGMSIPYKYYINIKDYESLDSKTKQDLLVYAVVLNDKLIEKYKDNLEEINLDRLPKLNKDYEKYIASLKDKTASNFTYTKQGATYTQTLEDDTFVVLTVPYDKGWTIKVNNKTTTIEELSNGLIGLFLSKGENKIVMEYSHPGFKLGLYISLISLVVSVIYISLSHYKERH